MLQDFHGKVPFMKGMLEAVMNRANNKGVIRTLLGRKCRFDLWEPTKWGVHKALPREVNPVIDPSGDITTDNLKSNKEIAPVKKIPDAI